MLRQLRQSLTTPVSPATRLPLAVGIGIIAGIFCYQIRLYFFPGAGDFSWAIFMARDVLQGRDPYNLTPSPLVIPYPLPIIFFGLPFVWLPNALAAACFFGLSSGLLAYGLLRAGPAWRLLTFLSLPYVYALLFAQWSPLIMAAWFMPLLAPALVLVKPQTTLPIALNKLTRPGVWIAVGLLVLSLILYPTWPLRWLSLIGQYANVIPVLALPFGPLLLLALVAWRRPEGRLLLLTALLPYRGAYDLLPLWIIPQTGPQMLALVVVTWLVAALNPQLGFTLIASPWAVPFICLPALGILLWDNYRPRPSTLPENELTNS